VLQTTEAAIATLMAHGVTLRIDMEPGGHVDGSDSIRFQFTPRTGQVFGGRCRMSASKSDMLLPWEQEIAQALRMLADQVVNGPKA